MSRHPVIEFLDLPNHIQEQLKEYYAGTDHRHILNDSYTRFPYIFPFEAEEDKAEPVTQWLFRNGVTPDDEYVLIHWDW